MAIRKGKVGTSLKRDSAINKMGENAKIGIFGEKYFWNMIVNNNNTNPYGLWASLGIPRVTKSSRSGNYRTKSYDSDVDFAMANGDTIVLVDAKMYASNKTYWSMGVNIMENFGYKRDKNGRKIVASRNMELALDRYRERVNEIRRELMKKGVKTNSVKIHALVVFVPTKGGRLPNSVRFMSWPGRIKSFLPEAGVRKIRRLLGKPVFSDGDVYINKAAVLLLNEQVKK